MTTRFLVGGVLAAAVATGAHADSEWDFEGRLYLWGSGIRGTTTTGQQVDVSFGDVVERLDFGLMGGIEARNGSWSLLGDFQFLQLSEGIGAAVGPGIPVTVDADVEGLIFTGAVGYDAMRTDLSSLTPFAGFRYLDLGVTANLAAGTGSIRTSGDRNNLDGIVGLRGGTKFNDRWGLNYYADIGTGDSDLTWQLAASIEYRVNERWTISVGYRHLAWEFDSPAVVEDIAFTGPTIGARFEF